MDRLLGAQDRRRAPEPEPSFQSNATSVRGIQHEEFSEAAPLDAPSVIAPALADESLKRSSMIAALPSGGPDPDAKTSDRPGRKGRVPLVITRVSGDSYKGAGRVERNERRADKRKAVTAKLAAEKEERKELKAKLAKEAKEAVKSKNVKAKPNAKAKPAAKK